MGSVLLSKEATKSPCPLQAVSSSKSACTALGWKSFEVNFLQGIIWDISDEIAPVLEVAHREPVTFNLLCFKIKIGSPASIHKTQCLSWERVFRSASVSTTIVSSTLRPLVRALSQMRLHDFGDHGSAASASQLRRG